MLVSTSFNARLTAIAMKFLKVGIWIILFTFLGWGTVTLINNQRAADKKARQLKFRTALFAEFKPIAIKNCNMKRYGDDRDGGYLLCSNLLKDIKVGYSYGIDGRDNWGCQISQELKIKIQQYDCFNSKEPVCKGGDFVFHSECIGAKRVVKDKRIFDSLTNQIQSNKDNERAIVMKMDVEGSEWESLMVTSDEILTQIDQLAIEFHQVDNPRYLLVLRKLKKLFYIADFHINNHVCAAGYEPFPSWAFEVLFVNKRLTVPDPSGLSLSQAKKIAMPNDSRVPDCQATFK